MLIQKSTIDLFDISTIDYTQLLRFFCFDVKLHKNCVFLFFFHIRFSKLFDFPGDDTCLELILHQKSVISNIRRR